MYFNPRQPKHQTKHFNKVRVKPVSDPLKSLDFFVAGTIVYLTLQGMDLSPSVNERFEADNKQKRLAREAMAEIRKVHREVCNCHQFKILKTTTDPIIEIKDKDDDVGVYTYSGDSYNLCKKSLTFRHNYKIQCKNIESLSFVLLLNSNVEGL